jgi:1-acyl-sn-glycerol-3-phosphate acyltransferase
MLMKTMYWFGSTLSYLVCRIFGHCKVIGAENVPKSGGVLLCSNHVSYMDPPAVSGGSPRLIHFMAKSELFKIPVLGWIIAVAGTFPVKRGTPDRAALKKAMEYLQAGEVVGVFPEGKRSLDGTLLEAELGVAMIALRAKVPVIPVGLVNTQKLLPPHSYVFHFSRVRIVFGPPVELSDLYDQSGREAMEECGRRIMSSIARLLDENDEERKADRITPK